MSSYVLTSPAKDDLSSIFRYTLETWGEDQVTVYAAQLESAFTRLAENPFLIGSRPAGQLAGGCRIFRVAHHVVAYRPETKYLLIARILHESMDFSRHVSDETIE